MQAIIDANINTLNKAKILLLNITDNQLADISVAPYYSSIGSHIRHVLDFYNCIFSGLPLKSVNLTLRGRDQRMHTDCKYAYNNIDDVLNKLSTLSVYNSDFKIEVIDDLGLGAQNITYTVAALLAQANSHAIHHYAIINYILKGLNINFEDKDFGYNPSTPKLISN